MQTRTFLVNGEWRTGKGLLQVKSPYDGTVVAEVGVPTEADVEEAAKVADETFGESRFLPVHARADALDHISRGLAQSIDDNAALIAREGGKPVKWAKVEATRAVSTFRWASEVLRHGADEVMRLDTEASLGSRLGIIRRISFTGSSEVGWYLKGLDPKKRVTLELGGNAGVIVHSDADLDLAAQRIAFGGYYQAGQSCISVQRVLVQSEVYDDFTARLVKQVESLKYGDPMDPTVDVGPLIDAGSLERIATWVDEAVAQGAEVLTGGRRDDPFYAPTVLARTSPEMKVRCEEIFGPVTTVSSYQTFEEAIAEVNNSRYGLQAGVFTRDIDRAFQAHREIEVGGVIVNDQSAFRADQMPYGGSKDSGFGREGLRFAMEEMTEPRIMVLSHVPL